MRGHFSADPRLFEDVHGLYKSRRSQTDLRSDRRQARIARKPIEVRIQIVQRMTYLIDRQVFLGGQQAIVIECALLEKKPNLAARRQKVIVGRRFLVGRAEYRLHRRGLEFVYQSTGPFDQPVARRVVGESGNLQKPIAVEGCDLIVGEHECVLTVELIGDEMRRSSDIFLDKAYGNANLAAPESRGMSTVIDQVIDIYAASARLTW
jgi:hypothetical protein